MKRSSLLFAFLALGLTAQALGEGNLSLLAAASAERTASQGKLNISTLAARG